VADFCGGACLPYDAHVAELRLAAMQAACRPAELGTCGEFRYTVSSDTPRLGQTPVHRYFDGSGRLIGVTHLVFAGDECPVDPPALYGVIPGCRREVVETLCRSADR
jgi:hypothetical protein